MDFLTGIAVELEPSEWISLGGTVATFLAVMVALILGVGNWRVDSRRQKRELERKQQALGIYLLSRLLYFEARCKRIEELFDDEFGEDRLERALEHQRTLIFRDFRAELFFDSVFPVDKAYQLVPLMQPESIKLISNLETLAQVWNVAMTSYSGPDHSIVMTPEQQSSVFRNLNGVRQLMDSIVGNLERLSGTTLAQVGRVEDDLANRSTEDPFPGYTKIETT